MVSGFVAHPAWETNLETQGEDLDLLKYVTRSILRIEGITYQQIEDQILSCFYEYGVPEKEEIGTRNYLEQGW